MYKYVPTSGTSLIYRVTVRWENGTEKSEYTEREWIAYTEACGNSLQRGVAYSRVDLNAGSLEEQVWKTRKTFCNGHTAWQYDD